MLFIGHRFVFFFVFLNYIKNIAGYAGNFFKRIPVTGPYIARRFLNGSIS